MIKTLLRLPQGHQFDGNFMLKAVGLQPRGKTSKRTDKDTEQIPPQMYVLRSPTQPALRQQPDTAEQPWQKQPPDQPMSIKQLIEAKISRRKGYTQQHTANSENMDQTSTRT
eukprot:4789997-Amphidinium_carterae.1